MLLWRVGGLRKQIVISLISTPKKNRIRFILLRTLLDNYLLSPPTLQV